MSMRQARGLVGRGSSLVAMIGAGGILIVSGTILLDILLRVLFNSPIEGLGDISKFTFAVVIASFYPVGLVAGHNVTIRFLGRALGKYAELWLDFFGAIITLAIVVMIAWKVFDFTAIVSRDGLATLTLEIPQAPWWWMVTAIFILCIGVQMFVLVDRLYRAITGELEDPEDSPDNSNVPDQN